MTLLLTCFALAQPSSESSGDVVISRVIRATPEVIAPAFEDTAIIEQLLPERCGYDWHHGKHPYGPADLMYNIKSFQRRLQVVLTVKKPLRHIEMDHLGPKGFITEFKFEPIAADTKVTITTYLNPPGWPMRSYYFKTVKPKWERCYDQMLDRLEQRVK